MCEPGYAGTLQGCKNFYNTVYSQGIQNRAWQTLQTEDPTALRVGTPNWKKTSVPFLKNIICVDIAQIRFFLKEPHCIYRVAFKGPPKCTLRMYN